MVPVGSGTLTSVKSITSDFPEAPAAARYWAALGEDLEGDTDAVVARLSALGATVVTPGALTMLADPEGNVFCVKA
ncbi:hypothetical protein AMIS_48060 [Actinoplanes missouriensis 431]|uniref:Glyoxalase-like domain-containing protein n=1 Tax=Actinoplanes missouriensis (strain ATCC 14538 / DSM 43046 / CBS 188.64 / JCM 3121 / NBRC 102363 / NCIMB 12654 / NRRL B-3342 / UNCC 431) TaxID=512565 RepID=I0HAI9_ACTM4|nr:VOC family protein [Actinoplanes missouriensis]BAL90026.1 hypothetical protein AMIS_48060 [Actinoplanes missouriensis 431]